MAEKILVVDDDLDTLRLVGLMLERQGYQILAASNGNQALSIARSERPDLILLDLMMPDIDGIEVARKLRSSPETKDMLIIMFTAKSQTDDKLLGFDAGADDYLTKPTQPRELIAHVKAVLKRAGMQPTVPARVYTERGRVIGIVGAKGGVGVSTLAVNLGIVLHQMSKKSVVVSDFRPGNGSIGLELGVDNPLGQSKLLASDVSQITPEAIERELTDHESGVRFLLASTRPEDAAFVSEVDKFEALARGLAFLGNYILLDLGSSITPCNAKIIEKCDQMIVVLEPVAQTVYQARLMLDYLSRKGIRDNRVIIVLVNRLRAGMQLSRTQVQDLLGRNISAIFTAAPELVYQAQVSKVPVVLRQSDSVTAKEFQSLAERFLSRLT